LLEMRDRSYGFNAVWADIPKFIGEVDVESMRREIGVH
jgi:hypothetical protein